MAPPPFRISLAHGSLLHLSPAELVRVAAATRYDAVGIRLVPVQRPDEPFHTLVDQPGVLTGLRRAVDETGVQVLDVEIMQILDTRAVRAYLPALEAAADIGARFVLAIVYTPDAAAAQDQLAELCDLAKPLGLTVALEFVSFSEVRTPARAVEILSACGRDNASVLVDTLHFHFSGAPASELSAVPSHLLHYMHICDAPKEVPATPADLRRITREERLMPGEGVIDLDGILQHLPKDLTVAVEVQNPARARELGAEVFARVARDMTITCLARAGRSIRDVP